MSILEQVDKILDDANNNLVMRIARKFESEGIRSPKSLEMAQKVLDISIKYGVGLYDGDLPS